MNNILNASAEQMKLLEEKKKEFDAQVLKMHESLGATHIKREFTFSTIEKRRLSQIQLMAVFIQDMLADIINLSVLPRLQIVPSPEVRILYDINCGLLCTWVPKVETKPK